MGCQKVPKSDFQSQFSVSNIIQIFLIFFIEEYELRSTFFAIKIYFYFEISYTTVNYKMYMK